MVLPFTPLSLTFHHLNYYVDVPKVLPPTSKFPTVDSPLTSVGGLPVMAVSVSCGQLPLCILVCQLRKVLLYTRGTFQALMCPYQPFWQLCGVLLMHCMHTSQGVSTDPDKAGPRIAEVGGKKMLQLLNDCSGAFRPGILTALVGSSGAGKTTLMDVLAGRKTSTCTRQFPFVCKIPCEEQLEQYRTSSRSTRYPVKQAFSSKADETNALSVHVFRRLRALTTWVTVSRSLL